MAGVWGGDPYPIPPVSMYDSISHRQRVDWMICLLLVCGCSTSSALGRSRPRCQSESPLRNGGRYSTRKTPTKRARHPPSATRSNHLRSSSAPHDEGNRLLDELGHLAGFIQVLLLFGTYLIRFCSSSGLCHFCLPFGNRQKPSDKKSTIY